jgi:hypothetical protein
MALQDHARLPVFFNSQYLTEVTSIRVSTDSGEQEVLTLEGLVGFTPGAGLTEITLKCTIPIGGTEAEFQQICANGGYCTMQVGCGSVSYEGTGKILNTDFGQDVNSAADFNVSWKGEKKAMQ